MLKVTSDAKVRIYYELANISRSDEKAHAVAVAKLLYKVQEEMVACEKLKGTVQMLKEELKDLSLIYFFKMREIYRSEICKRRWYGLEDRLVEDVLRNPLTMKYVNQLIDLVKGEKKSSFRNELLDLCLLSQISHQDDRGAVNLLNSLNDFQPNSHSIKVVINLVCNHELMFDFNALIRLISAAKNWKVLADYLLEKADHRDVSASIPAINAEPLKTYLQASFKV